MTAAYQILPDDSLNTGKKVDCDQVVVNGQAVLQQRVQVTNYPDVQPVTLGTLGTPDNPLRVSLPGADVDRELVVSTYYAKNSFTGASSGDTITATQVIDVTSAPITIATIWRNQTTGVDLSGTPAASNLTLVSSAALTDAQLRASPVPFTVTATRATSTVSILSGASTSSTVDLLNTALVGFLTPAAWTAADLRIEVSVDGTNWYSSIFGTNGSLVTYYASPVVSSAYAIDAGSFLPYRYVRFRSGTSGSPVNQAAQRDFTVITRPIA